MSHIPTNLERYGRWLVVSQTPLAVAGIAALFIPAKAIWRTHEQQRAAWLLGASVIVVWALYLIYTPFDAWWFLRFLLPAWPAMCLGAAAVLVRIAQARGVALRAGTCAIVVAIDAPFFDSSFSIARGWIAPSRGSTRRGAARTSCSRSGR